MPVPANQNCRADLLVATLLIWLLLPGAQSTTQLFSSSSEFDPFLATDIPTATVDTAQLTIPLQSPDLSSTDFLIGMTTATYSIPAVSSSVTMSMTATATATVASGAGLVVTTVASSCVSGSGSCFISAPELGAKGPRLQSQSVAVLLLVALVASLRYF